jgi:hypothetical protein
MLILPRQDLIILEIYSALLVQIINGRRENVRKQWLTRTVN